MRQLAVPGAITGLLALAGFIVAHSVLIPWANPRFLFGAAFQGAVPALIGGMAAAWLYQRSAQRISRFPASGALFGLALWFPIVPMELVALAFGAQRADAGGLVVILSLLAPTLIVALGAWRYLGGWRGATGAALAVLPGVMFIGGGAVDAGGVGTTAMLFVSTLFTYVLCGVVVSVLVPGSRPVVTDRQPV